MLENIRNIARYKLGGNSLLIQLYKLKKKNRTLIVNTKHDICIEAYPRTANTFSVLMVEQCAKSPVLLAHHMHSAGQIRLSKKYNIPLIILIRRPIDCIVSNLIRDKGMTPKTAINWYQDFYTTLLNTNIERQIWRFESITNKPERCLEGLERFTGIEFDYSKYNKQEIFNRIKALANKQKKSGKLEHNIAIPTDERNAYKINLIKDINANYSKELNELNRVYELVLTEKDVI